MAFGIYQVVPNVGGHEMTNGVENNKKHSSASHICIPFFSFSNRVFFVKSLILLPLWTSNSYLNQNI